MPDFGEIKRVCNGMMRPEVYAALHEAARACRPPFAEVGTAHGASAVSLGLAGKVYTFDRFEGGSRARYGGKAANLAILRKALARFPQAEVEVVVGDVAETAEAVTEPRFGLLFLDCDGRIDRDFAAFLDRVDMGGPVIVDDFGDRIRLKNDGQVDQKYRITKLLVESAERHGLIERQRLLGSTWFGRRTGSFAVWPAAAILECYRELVFGRVTR